MNMHAMRTHHTHTFVSRLRRAETSRARGFAKQTKFMMQISQNIKASSICLRQQTHTRGGEWMLIAEFVSYRLPLPSSTHLIRIACAKTENEWRFISGSTDCNSRSLFLNAPNNKSITPLTFEML